MSTKKSFSIVDIIIIIIILVVAVAGLFFVNTFSNSGNVVQIIVDGKVYKEVKLESEEKQEFNINDTNVVVIENGEAYMKSAECPDQVCVKKGKIRSVDDTIICVPNNVQIVIDNVNEAEDAAW